ncbi:MAG: tRNA (adenosine(37)-N6)-threonylcarbamoyltransferase complex dimerization subunit type 1 TsaB [Cellulosilyticaceae bacterium]
MNIIALDASGVAGSVAYFSEGKLVGEYYVCHKLTHSQTIMPMLEDMKKLIGFDLKDVDVIATTSGPGSFTGIRIGVSTAKAMAMALEVPIVGISTLDVMAHNVTFTESIICPIMDARRQQVYTACYQWQKGKMVRLTDHLGMMIDELLEHLKTYDKSVIFVGDGVSVFEKTIKEALGERALFVPSYMMMQRASVVAHLAAIAFEKGEAVDADEFVPDYLRKSQAERELEEKNSEH